MQIKIAERLKPYSHLPGSVCVLPGSFFQLQIFPALVRIYDLRMCMGALHDEFPINVEGPVKDFTIQQDLEKGWVFVWGKTPKGFMRYKIVGHEDQFSRIDKNGDAIQLKPALPIERLSLGSHKAQDWELMRRRGALEEILPIWFRLGQLSPKLHAGPLVGTAVLLDECQHAIETKNRLAILPAFHKLWLTGFAGMLSPRLSDEEHHGFYLPKLSPGALLSPLILLTEGAKLIRSLFIQQESNLITILPVLPPEFHCGRLVGIQCQGLGTLDLEWSKKMIRRLVVHAARDAEICFDFRDATSFRLRKGTKDRGVRVPAAHSIKIEQNSLYFLDNFML